MPCRAATFTSKRWPCCAVSTFSPISPLATSGEIIFRTCWPADDGDPKTMAPLHPVKILWNTRGGGKELYGSMAGDGSRLS